MCQPLGGVLRLFLSPLLGVVPGSAYEEPQEDIGSPVNMRVGVSYRSTYGQTMRVLRSVGHDGYRECQYELAETHQSIAISARRIKRNLEVGMSAQAEPVYSVYMLVRRTSKTRNWQTDF